MVEVCVLSVQHTVPVPGQPYTISPLTMAGEAAVAALVCIPAACIFAVAFVPATAWHITKNSCKMATRCRCTLLDRHARDRPAPVSYTDDDTCTDRVHVPSSLSSQPAGLDKPVLVANGPAQPAARAVKGAYASAQSPEDESRAYDEHCLHNMRALSLTRACRENPINKAVLANILCGWIFNWLSFGFLMTVFVAYGCSFSRDGMPVQVTESLLQAWVLTSLVRFLFFEPAMIVAKTCLPQLFRSELAHYVCGETVVSFVDSTSQAVVRLVAALTSP